MFIRQPLCHTKLGPKKDVANAFEINPLDAPGFWRNVRKTARCWWWIGQRGNKGYGKFRGIIASRYSFAMHYYDPPTDMCVCHTCDNPSCVRPDHLVLGTYHENSLDMVNKGRATQVGNKQGCNVPSERLVMMILELGREGFSQLEISRAIPCRWNWVKLVRSQYPKVQGGTMQARFKNASMARLNRR